MTLSPQALTAVADELDTLRRERDALKKEVKALRFAQGIWEGAALRVAAELNALRAQQEP